MEPMIKKTQPTQKDNTKEVKQQDQNQQQNQFDVEDHTEVELTPQELLKQIESGKLTIEELERMYVNGKISEENYLTVLEIINSQSEDPTDQYIQAMQNGEMTEMDLNNALANGEITQDQYNNIIDGLNGVDELAAEDAMAPQEELVSQPVEAKFKSVKLYEKFCELKKYITIYVKSFDYIETDSISQFQLERIAKLFDEIVTLRTNLEFYLENNYKLEEYNKNLYSYLLFNKEFVDEIRRFRKVLALDPSEIIERREAELEQNKKNRELKDKK